MSPETIRGHALECVHLAQNTFDPQHRSLLLDMAHSWADLANTADQFQRLVEASSARWEKNGQQRVRLRKARPARRPWRRSRGQGSSVHPLASKSPTVLPFRGDVKGGKRDPLREADR